jgi:serine/threonine protein phosphatase 1
VNAKALDPDRFAPLTGARRVWAVGAVHANADALRSLHAVLAQRFRHGDRLVYLGNYYGPGPDVIGTVDELLLFRRELMTRAGMEPWDIAYLRGAQEEMWNKLLQLQFAADPAAVLEWMLKQGLGETLKAYGGDAEAARGILREGAVAITRWTSTLRNAVHARLGHDELIATLRRAAYTSGGELLFVHAGIDPARPLTEQGDTFWWGSGHFVDIVDPYDEFHKVVRGYDRAHLGVVDGTFAATVDGGCGYGGRLTAGCFDTAGAAVDWIEA